jgi:sarcosine oxidase subunit alpha
MSTQSRRLPTGGRIDRDTVWTFTIDGVEYTGHPGDTVASGAGAGPLERPARR